MPVYDTPDWTQAAPVTPSFLSHGVFTVDETGVQASVLPGVVGSVLIPLEVSFSFAMPAEYNAGGANTYPRGIVTLEVETSVGTTILPHAAISPEQPFVRMPVLYAPQLLSGQGLRVTAYSQPGCGTQVLAWSTVYQVQAG